MDQHDDWNGNEPTRPDLIARIPQALDELVRGADEDALMATLQSLERD